MNAARSLHRHSTIPVISLILANAIPQQIPAAEPHGFGPPRELVNNAKLSAQVDAIGDFNGDGRDDIASFWRSSFTNHLVGDVVVALTTADGIAAGTTWHDFFSINDEYPLTGDFNGDGMDDIITFTRGTTGDVFVALSDGSSFGPGQLWHGSFCIGGEIPVVADINGDGKDDILTFTRGTSARVFAALSTGSGFTGTGSLWHSSFCPGDAFPAAGDFDGDGKDDIVSFYRSSQTGQAQGDVIVALSTGTNFGSAHKWHEWFSIGDEVPLVGDFDADGRDDIATCTRGTGADVYVALSTSTEFRSTSAPWHSDFAGGTTKQPYVGNFNLDLNSDLLSLRATTGFGRVELALAGGHAHPRKPDVGEFGYGTMGVPWAIPPLASRPDLVQIPLVVVLVEVPGRPDFASAGRDRNFFDQMFFGSGHPNIRDYFLEMSAGKFAFSRYTVVGPIQVDPSDAPGNDIRNIIGQELANRGIDFRPFDTDGSGAIENTELNIALVDNVTDAAGQTGSFPQTATYPGGSIQIHCAIAAAGYRGVFDLYAHELMHVIGAYDMYSSGCYATDATLMHCNATTQFTSIIHLDPFHKMRLGWATPGVYDLRYPGGAFIDIAQTAGLPGKNPPILLSDPGRDPREFYMLDYRNPDWNGGTLTQPGRPAAGYDVGATRTTSGGPGFGLWYYNINAVNQFVGRHAFIRPGDDSLLNSTPAPGSDDFVSGSLILPGPDGIIQSALSGDDVYRDDAMAFLSGTPATYATRWKSDLRGAASGVINPQWFDRSLVADGLDMRLQEGTTTSPTGYVQWGKNFTPFISLTSAPVATAGDPIAIAGNLGIRDPGSSIPAIVNRDHAYDLPVTQWTVAVAALKIPLIARPGEYRLLVYADESRQLVSNSMPITIENPYYLWAATALPGVLDTDPDLALPFADADGNGWVNIAEYLLDSDPLDPAEPQLTYTPRSGQPTQVRWTEYSGRSEFVSARAQISTDLLTWTDQTSSVVAQSGPRISRAIVLPGTSPRYFVRLVFETAD